jgi:hypothetical protein
MPAFGQENDSSTEKGSQLVTVGETRITLQQLQQIHSELTGNTESITKYYEEPILASAHDIEQLYHYITQTLEQYNAVSSNCSFIIYYAKNTKDTFTSFDRFKLQASGGSSPVESVLIKYEFLILLPNLQKSQSYSISVRAVSRFVMEDKIRKDLNVNSLSRMFRVMSSKTVIVDISYVDYAVARTFVSAIDDWFKTVPQSPANATIRFLQSNSHWIPRLTKAITVVFLGALINNLIPHFIAGNEFDLLLFARLALWICVSAFLVYSFVGWSASFAEYSIDGLSELSYIELNKADKAMVKKSIDENKSHLMKAIGGVAGAIIIDCIAKIAECIITTYL